MTFFLIIDCALSVSNPFSTKTFISPPRADLAWWRLRCHCVGGGPTSLASRHGNGGDDSPPAELIKNSDEATNQLHVQAYTPLRRYPLRTYDSLIYSIYIKQCTFSIIDKQETSAEIIY